MIRDPAGLLGRIAELEPLCSDPGIRRAVEKGDPFKVYRAVWWARWTGKLTAHRRTLDLLLANRRAFAKPLSGKLFLGTFNSVGATLLGSAEEEPDGTYIATHAVVALFAVPLFPLGAYVVAGGGRKGLSTSWNIFARVPLGALSWLCSRGIALAVVAAVAWAGVAAVWSTRHRDLTIVNGLDVPVQATIGDASREVMSGGVVTLSVPVGTLHARAVTGGGKGGVELESFDLPVPAGGGRSALVWNVAGAAPVYEDTVEYSTLPPDGHKPPESTLHCGDRIVDARGVDYAFRTPPESISMGKGVTREVRRRLDLVGGLDVPHWEACTNALFGNGRDADALHVIEARAAAHGWERDPAMLVLRVAASVSPAEGERVARILRAARPDDVIVHRSYQDTLEAAGKGAEVVAEYRQRAAAAPDSSTAQYLVLRLLDGEEQRSGAEAALARFPDDPDLLRLVTALRAEAGDFAGTAALYPRLRAASPEQAVQVIDEEAAALVLLGRRAEARTELASLFEALPPGNRYDPAVLYARLAALDGSGSPDALVKRLEEKGPDPFLRARAGLPAPPVKGEAPVVPALYALAVKDPAAALEKLKPLPPAVGLQLDRGLWALLFCEAARVGSPVEAMLLAHTRVPHRHLEALRRFVRGEPGVVLPALSLEIRAAARFVRSRSGAVPPAERAALLAGARRDDPLATYVTEAIARWPAAAR